MPAANIALNLGRLCRREGEARALGLDTSKQTEDALSVHAPLAVAAWKGKGSLNVLVSKGMLCCLVDFHTLFASLWLLFSTSLGASSTCAVLIL